MFPAAGHQNALPALLANELASVDATWVPGLPGGPGSPDFGKTCLLGSDPRRQAETEMGRPMMRPPQISTNLSGGAVSS